jgi:hypothetical protein
MLPGYSWSAKQRLRRSAPPSSSALPTRMCNRHIRGGPWPWRQLSQSAPRRKRARRRRRIAGSGFPSERHRMAARHHHQRAADHRARCRLQQDLVRPPGLPPGSRFPTGSASGAYGMAFYKAWECRCRDGRPHIRHRAPLKSRTNTRSGRMVISLHASQHRHRRWRIATVHWRRRPPQVEHHPHQLCLASRPVLDLHAEGSKRDEVTRALEQSERQLKFAEAQIAKGLGFTLCHCDNPPTPMLTVGWIEEGTNAAVHRRPRCGTTDDRGFGWTPTKEFRMRPDIILRQGHEGMAG